MGYEKSEKTMGGKANTSGNDHGSGTFVRIWNFCKLYAMGNKIPNWGELD